MAKWIDRTGQRFGRLVAVSHSGNGVWLFHCDCGATRRLQIRDVAYGRTQSCGCKRREATANRSFVHGHAPRGGKTKEYGPWEAMLARCTNPHHAKYAYYGGRGISICEAWRNSFAAFLVDVGPRPSPAHTLERGDNNRGYEPGNVRWATRGEQSRNQRNTRWVTLDGKRLTVAELADRTGIPSRKIRERLDRGWSPERATA